MTARATRLAAVVATSIALFGGWLADARVRAQAQGQAPRPAVAPIRVLPLRGNVYLLSGAGGNIVASVGKDGVMLVDTGAPAMAQAVLAAVQDLSRRITSAPMAAKSCVGISQGCNWWSSSELLPTTTSPRAPRPLSGIIYTSDDADHIGGNDLISAAGRTYGVRNIDGTLPGAWVLVQENASLREAKPGQPTLLANETYPGPEKKLNFFNGEAVVVTHLPAAHSDADSLVYFRGSEVLVAGDILDMTKYPVIDVARGGTIQGEVDALNWILDVAVVEHMMEGGTLVVPGHGRMTDSADVAYYRDMVTIMRDRVRDMSKKGMTLEQIKAARPTRDYDGRFGTSTTWTPNMFVEAIFNTLTPKK
jgi:glyoxylase-like metal-dependent hydrolase (beta-lactamase superfamily II)